MVRLANFDVIDPDAQTKQLRCRLVKPNTLNIQAKARRSGMSFQKQGFFLARQAAGENDLTSGWQGRGEHMLLSWSTHMATAIWVSQCSFLDANLAPVNRGCWNGLVKSVRCRLVQPNRLNIQARAKGSGISYKMRLLFG